MESAKEIDLKNSVDQDKRNPVMRRGKTRLRDRLTQPDRNSCTSGQAAKILGIPDRTIRRYLSTKKIEGVQNPITGTWHISRDALIRFVKQKGCDFNQFPFSINILIVDDEPTMVNFIIRCLNKSLPDALLHVSKDACDALIQIGDIHPDIVLLDAKMPILHGRDILMAMKNSSTTQEINVLALGGLPEDLEELSSLGANDTLSKPFTLDELMAKIETLLPFGMTLGQAD